MPTHPLLSRVLLFSSMAQPSIATEHADCPDSFAMHASAGSLRSSPPSRSRSPARREAAPAVIAAAETTQEDKNVSWEYQSEFLGEAGRYTLKRKRAWVPMHAAWTAKMEEAFQAGKGGHVFFCRKNPKLSWSMNFTDEKQYRREEGCTERTTTRNIRRVLLTHIVACQNIIAMSGGSATEPTLR